MNSTMNSKSPAIIFLLILSNYSFAQNVAQGDPVINPLWELYSTNNLSAAASGKGFTGIAGTNDLSAVVLNPATLSIPGKIHVHAESIYKGDVQWSTVLSFSVNKSCLKIFAYTVGTADEDGRMKFSKLHIRVKTMSACTLTLDKAASTAASAILFEK